MNGVVSLLGTEHYRIVEDLWQKLETRFGVRGVTITPYPHFSYQIAEQYDESRLEAALAQLAAKQSAFTVRTAGIATFTGPEPVVYIPVVRDLELSHFHLRVCNAITGIGTGVSPYYDDKFWMPHITIGFGDITPDALAGITHLLAKRSFDWEIPIDNLAYINVQNGKQTLKSRFTLAA